MDPVVLSQLQDVLIHSFHPDTTLRKQAEEYLSNFLNTSGAIQALLSFVGNRQQNRDLRQAAAIQVKNKIRGIWSSDKSTSSPTVGLSPNFDTEKEAIKSYILPLLLTETDNSVRGLLAETIRCICEFDFPDKWNSLIPTLLEAIQSAGQNILQMYNALLALRKLVKRYEYKNDAERQPLNDIASTSFPMLQQLTAAILENNSLEASQVMRMCLKILYSANAYKLLMAQGFDVNFWFRVIAYIIQKPLPEASTGQEPLNQPVEPEEKRAWPWWKLKKWAGRLMCTFIQRYGNPRYTDEAYSAFATYFRDHVAASLLPSVMEALLVKARGGFLTEDVHRYCLTYLNNCVEMSPSYKFIKGHLNFVLYEVLFPTLSLTSEDVALFSEDPQEFIRKVHDPYEDYLDPSVAAINLLQTMARYRKKDIMPLILQYIQETLASYSAASVETKNYLKKDGVLVCFGALCSLPPFTEISVTTFAACALFAPMRKKTNRILKDSKKYRHLMEPFLITHVIPEFQSPVPYLRYRACWIIEHFDEEEWKNPLAMQSALQGLLTGLRDPALPVQAAAACSIKHLLEAEGAAEIMRPYISDIVAEYFRIMDETQNDSVLGALQSIVETFKEDIYQIAPGMVTRLVNRFKELTDQGSNDDDEAAMFACETLDTILCIIDSLETHPQELKQVEAVVYPLIVHLLTADENCFEYLEPILAMIKYFTYYDDNISPTMWSLCGPLFKALDEWAADYLGDFMSCFMNYMTKDMRQFLVTTGDGGLPLPTIFLQIMKKTLSNSDVDSYGESRDCKSALSLLTCFLVNNKETQAIHELIRGILEMVITKLVEASGGKKASSSSSKPKSNESVKVKALETVMAAIYYDPAVTISVLNSEPQAAQLFFSQLFILLPHMEHPTTQRIIVLSLSSLMLLPSNSLPPLAAQNLPAIVQQLIRESVFIEEQAGKEGDECDDNDDDDDDDDDDENDFGGAGCDDDIPEDGYDEDQDCYNAEDEAYLAHLQRRKEKASSGSGGQVFMDGEPVDDEDLDYDDFSFTSHIDEVDTLKFFIDAMKTASLREPSLFSTIQTNLETEDQTRFKELHEILQNRLQ